jgi:outer membrane protein OmpA-like peptidoglycan-associated protein
MMIKQSCKKAMLCILPLMLCGVFLTPLSAQTAGRMEAMLNKDILNWDETVVFALEASDLAAFSDPDEAFEYARSRKWLPRAAQPGEPARLDGVALLLMRAFDLKGGIFYSLTKNPHYAYRELMYQEVIQGRSDPAMPVSGEDFLFMLGRILSLIDDTPTGPAETIAAEPVNIEVEAERLAQHEALAAEINIQLADLADTTAEATVEGIIIRLSNIQFIANSAELSEGERQKLREIAEILKSIPEKRILIGGHTAMAGTREDRHHTSLERAQSAASYLIALGARKFSEIDVVGYGADRPIADNRTPQGMAMNRRVEIIILDN